ncbi:DUF4336 domain-containing protein [Microvirga splendida]|uniref:DUF4336 domain-containing protein n=1 Tax=Microvirga splendida TaxID=2795727 RepID=A0ABS0XVR4_9HYPH|nr:DUF4336 domain-containing protein [Microvirga splendida]MBJ6124129.1 DUF4336 domain-containing protein [Microvirga splendida]
MCRDAYVPYEPLNVLKPVAPDVWIVDGPEIRLSYMGLKLPFPTRMTVVRLPDGGLWIHSPIEPDGALVERILALGPIRFLIAPNTLHYWWVPDWKARFPEAEVHGVPGLDRKAKRPLPVDRVLGDAPAAAWADVMDQVLVHGDGLTEADFFHRPSQTLILTDLIENFEMGRVRQWFYRWLLRLAGPVDPDGKTPVDLQLSFLRQRRAVKAAVRRMIAWSPERVIIAHGRWYDGNGTAELQRAFRWVL